MSVSGVSRDDLTPTVAGADPPSAADPLAGDPPAPDSVVEVMEEGGAAPVSGVPPSCADGGLISEILSEERFNQLHEFVTQDSQSVLLNCAESQINFDSLINVDTDNDNDASASIIGNIENIECSINNTSSIPNIMGVENTECSINNNNNNSNIEENVNITSNTTKESVVNNESTVFICL